MDTDLQARVFVKVFPAEFYGFVRSWFIFNQSHQYIQTRRIGEPASNDMDEMAAQRHGPPYHNSNGHSASIRSARGRGQKKLVRADNPPNHLCLLSLCGRGKSI
jgi:hypothetical protein